MELLGSRATFHARGARLRVEHVRETDQGDYWCRVDFRINPTLVFSTRLSVIGESSFILQFLFIFLVVFVFMYLLMFYQSRYMGTYTTLVSTTVKLHL